MTLQDPDQSHFSEVATQALQVVLEPHQSTVHDLDDLVDTVAQLETAVFDTDPALGERHEPPVQIEHLIIHLLPSRL